MQRSLTLEGGCRKKTVASCDRDRRTIHSQLDRLSSVACLVRGLAGKRSPVLVPHRRDHQGTAHVAERRCDDPQVRGNIVPMERPGDGEGLISLGDNAGHLGKGALVHHLPSKCQWQKIWWI